MRAIFVVFTVILLTGLIATPAWAQSTDRSSGYYGPYSVYGPGLTYKPTTYTGPYSVSGPALSSRPSYFTVPTFTSLRVQSSVVVPDGGEALVAGYSSVYEGRREAGVPVLGKVPYLGRGFGNVAAGRSISRTTVSVRARVIILSEEEERQTGVRP
jgi:hypothetical protein